MNEQNTTDNIREGWVDLQVNGHGGLSFSRNGLTVDDVRCVTEELVRRGTAAYCPTVTSGKLEMYERNLPVLADAMAAPDLHAHLLGIHIEGPFLAGAASGAHHESLLRLPDVALFAHWQTLARGGIRMLTLAPELAGAEALIRYASESGVVVSLGHHMADTAAISRAVDAGARCCTHLGNGIPNTLARHPNPIWSQLADDRLTGMFITDGHHIPSEFVRVALRAKGLDRFIVTSDASSLAGMPPGEYPSDRIPAVLYPDGRLALKDGSSLAGSSATMRDCMAWLQTWSGLSDAELRQIGRINALNMLGITSVG